MINKNLHVFNDEDEEDVDGVESEGSCVGGDIECLCPKNAKSHVISRIRRDFKGLTHFRLFLHLCIPPSTLPCKWTTSEELIKSEPLLEPIN